MHIEITTTIPCINDCKFCPQDKLFKAYKLKKFKLTIENFNIILNKIPNDLLVCFSGFSEPFGNEDVVDMILDTQKRGNPIKLDTTLVGYTLDIAIRLKDVKFEHIALHMPDDFNFLYDDDLWLHTFYDYFLKYNKSPYSIQYHIGEPREDMPFNALKPPTQPRAGNVNPSIVKHITRKDGKLSCYTNAMDFVVLPNGDTLMCCMDWSIKHKLGNLLVDSYEDIINSAERARILKGTDPDIICRYCVRAVQEKK